MLDLAEEAILVFSSSLLGGVTGDIELAEEGMSKYDPIGVGS